MGILPQKMFLRLECNCVHAQSTEAVFELGQWESLCQKISNHLIGGDVSKHHMSSKDTVPDRMVYHINVLGCRAHYTILEKSERRLVVCVDREDGDRKAKVLEHLPEPQCLIGSRSSSIVLCFTSGLGNHTLELGLPGDRVAILGPDPSSGRFLAREVSCLVRVAVALERGEGRVVGYSKVPGPFEVSENAVCCSNVGGSRGRVKPTQQANNVFEV
jgi:hypothetical protein